MLPELVIFDVEGTLVDSVPQTLQCWRETFLREGYDFEIRELQLHSGQDPDDMIRELIGGIEAEAKASKLKRSQSESFRANCLAQVTPFPGVFELFTDLRSHGHRIALATTSSGEDVSYYLKILKIEALLQAVICGEEVRSEKPHPDLIQRALSNCGVSAGAMMIGDTPFDAIAAHKAGIPCIGLLTGGFSESSLMAAGCVRVFADLRAFHTRLGRSC